MKKSLMGLTLAATVTFAGCQTAGTPIVVDPRVTQVEAAIQKICGWIPNAGVVTALLGAGGFQSYLDIAQTVCAAVTVRSGRAKSGPVVFNGVVLQGRFVR